MNKKYKIISYAAIFPMTFSFHEEGEEGSLITFNVDIDYLNQKVYFGENESKYPDINFSDLEKQIFQELVPEEVETPEISEEIFERAKHVREDDYTKKLMKNMNGESYDRW